MLICYELNLMGEQFQKNTIVAILSSQLDLLTGLCLLQNQLGVVAISFSQNSVLEIWFLGAGLVFKN